MTVVSSVVSICMACAKPRAPSSAQQIIIININNKYIIQPCKIKGQIINYRGKANAKEPLIFKERLSRRGQHTPVG